MSYNNINPATPNPNPNEEKDTAIQNAAGPEYPNVLPINLPGGVFRIDSTPGKEEINIRHKSGSFITFDTNGDIHLHTVKDIKIEAQRNAAIKSGQSVNPNGKSDEFVLTVVGDAKLQVQNDLHVEVWGNKYETVSKDCFLNVKGNYTVTAANINTKASGVYTEDAYEKVNKNTFQTNKIGIPGPDGAGGQIKDVIFGNRVIEMADPRGIFSIISAGDMEFIVAKNLKQAVGGVYTGTVGGAYSENVGGAMDVKVGGASKLNVGATYDINVGGIMKVTAAQIYLN